MSPNYVHYYFINSNYFIPLTASAVRRFKIDVSIDHLKDIEVASLMITDLLNQLRVCTVTGSLYTLFAHPPTTCPIFYPNLAKTETGKRKTYDDKDNENTSMKKEKKGSITNTTGKKLFIPKGMIGRYYSDFLEVNRTCAHGENCRFTHAVYPDGFEGNNAKIFEEYINSAYGLSFVKKNSSEKK